MHRLLAPTGSTPGHPLYQGYRPDLYREFISDEDGHMIYEDEVNYHQRRATQEFGLALSAAHAAARSAHLALFQFHSERYQALEGSFDRNEELEQEPVRNDHYIFCL